MAEDELLFVWQDFLVFGASLLICTIIGLVQGIRDHWGLKTKEDEGAQGVERNFRILPVVFSVIASSFSADAVLGVAPEIYFFGTEFTVFALGMGIGVPTGIFLFVKKLYELGIPDVFDYIGLRFGKEMKTLLFILYVLVMILFLGVILYAPALAFAESSEMPKWVSILITGGICIIYTTLGGLRGVLWIDTLQALVILAIGISNCVYGTYKVGNIGKVWEIADNSSRIEWPTWNADPTIRYSFWSCSVGGLVIMWLTISNQAITQKFLGLSSMKRVVIAGTCYLFGFELFMLTYMLSGLVMSAYYTTVSCEPVLSGGIQRADQLVPYFVLDLYQDAPGVSGLFTAAVFGVALSLMAAGINALAAISMEDLVLPLCIKKGQEISPKKSVFIFKGLSVFWGVVCLCVAFLASLMGQNVLQIGLSVIAVISGPMVGILLLGMYVPFAEKIGSFVGVVLAAGFVLALMIGGIVHPADLELKELSPGVCPVPNITMTSLPTMMTSITQSMMSTPVAEPSGSDGSSGFYEISYLLYSPLGVLIMFISSMLVSILVRLCNGHYKGGCLTWPEVDPKLLHLPKRAVMAGIPTKEGYTQCALVNNDEVVVTLNKDGSKEEITYVSQI